MNIIDREPSFLTSLIMYLLEKIRPPKDDPEERARLKKMMVEKGFHFEEEKKD